MGEVAVEDPKPFTLLRFNPVRAWRGAPAAEVKVDDGANEMVLWMSERDLRRNIEAFGQDAELLKAQEYYKRRTVRFPETT